MYEKDEGRRLVEITANGDPALITIAFCLLLCLPLRSSRSISQPQLLLHLFHLTPPFAYGNPFGTDIVTQVSHIEI